MGETDESTIVFTTGLVFVAVTNHGSTVYQVTTVLQRESAGYALKYQPDGWNKTREYKVCVSGYVCSDGVTNPCTLHVFGKDDVKSLKLFANFYDFPRPVVNPWLLGIRIQESITSLNQELQRMITKYPMFKPSLSLGDEETCRTLFETFSPNLTIIQQQVGILDELSREYTEL